MLDKPNKLLLVEPHPADAELTSRILIQALEECEVYVAPDAISYATHFADGSFSAVISELNLGWSSGTEILESFAKRHPGTRLVLFAQKLPPNIESIAKRMGLSGYAEKNSVGFLQLPDLARDTIGKAPVHEGCETVWSEALEQMEEPSLTILRDGRILQANQAAAQVFGYSKPEDLHDSVLTELLDHRRSSLHRMDDLIQQLQSLGEKGVRKIELTVAPATDPLQVGRKQLIGWPIFNSQRIALIYHTLSLTNTETKSTDGEDNQQAYADLLYSVSHDLQEPLQLVSRHAKLLQNAYGEQLDSNGARFLENLINNTDHMQSMLDDLLELSRLGNMASIVNEVDLNAIVQHVVSMFQSRLSEIGGRVRCADLPKTLADHGQMIRLFQNLIGNAIKFRSDDSLDVHIGSRINENCLEIVVKDNGIGIAPSSANSIFKMFKRFHTQGEYSGNGMGLALCQRIVTLHGGKIWARPRALPKSGLAIHFTICTKDLEQT